MPRIWLLSGVPRSGTSLCCRLAGALPDTVALSEPIRREASGGTDAPHGACARIGEFAEQARALILSERRARMAQSRAHAQMPSTMYASTPDPSPPPHPFTLDVTLKSAPERSGAKVSARSAARVGHRIALFPAASHWARENGYQGFARVINRSDAAGDVHHREFYRSAFATEGLKAYADAIPPEDELEQEERYRGVGDDFYSTLRRQAQLTVLAFNNTEDFAFFG